MGGNKLLRVSLVGTALMVAAFGGIYFYAPKQPRYQGRTFMTWVAIADYYEKFPAPPGKDPKYSEWTESENAIKEIGTNAAPYVAEQLLLPPSSKLKATFISWINRYAPAGFHMRSDRERIELAIAAVSLLRDNRKALWPFLVQATRSNDPERRLRAVFWLRRTEADRETFLPVLLRLLNDPAPEIRDLAVTTCCSRYPRDALAAGLFTGSSMPSAIIEVPNNPTNKK